MNEKVWKFAPNSGGNPIPPNIRMQVQKNIEKFAAAHYAGQYTRLEFRFKGQFCYIDAYQEAVIDGWALPPETPEERLIRLQNTPIHLCRLRYFKDGKWGFCLYNYGPERYELSVFPDGSFFGTAEDAFRCAGVFLES